MLCRWAQSWGAAQIARKPAVPRWLAGWLVGPSNAQGPAAPHTGSCVSPHLVAAVAGKALPAAPMHCCQPQLACSPPPRAHAPPVPCPLRSRCQEEAGVRPQEEAAAQEGRRGGGAAGGARRSRGGADAGGRCRAGRCVWQGGAMRLGVSRAAVFEVLAEGEGVRGGLHCVSAVTGPPPRPVEQQGGPPARLSWAAPAAVPAAVRAPAAAAAP